MKNIVSKVTTYVVLPGLVVMAVSALISPMVPNIDVPTVVISSIADSGERWYSPLSWKLDEAAAMAHSQAQEAATAATSAAVTTSTTFAIGAVWAGMALIAVAVSTISSLQNKEEILEAYKSRKTTVSPNVEQEDDEGTFMTGASTPKHKNPTEAQVAQRFGQEEQIATHPAVTQA